MLNIFRKKGEILTLKITGMHCTSCSMSIDNSLEDIDGVYSSATNYAKSISSVNYDKKLVTPDKIVKEVTSLGYEATIIR